MSRDLQRRGATASNADSARSTRIALLLERKSNRERLVEWLPTEYEVVPFDDGETPFDLCIVDEPMLERHHEELRRRKTAATPTFLPYLLVSASNGLHRDGRVGLVDETLSIPTRKSTLHARLRTLLERRADSRKLSDELGRQRALFQRIFESSNDAIVVVDPDTESIRMSNPQACELLGYTEAEFRRLSPRDIHPDDYREYREFRETTIEDGRGWIETTCRRKDGTVLDCEMSGSALSIADRPHVVASIRDVTARAEQRRILDGLHDVTTELMDARETQEIADVVVDTAERVFGYEAAGVQRLSGEAPPTTELVAASDTWRRLGNPSSSDRSHGPIERVWSEREPEIVDDLRSVDPSVEYDPIRSALCLPLGAEGVLSVESTAVGEFSETDIELVEILTSNATVALTRAERDRTLRERTRDLSALFENTTDSIADVEFVDGGPRIRDVNGEFERVFGHDRDEIRGRSLLELTVPSMERDAAQNHIHRAMDGTQIETEVRRETATGRRDFLARVVPIQRDESTLGAYVVYTDITDRKRRNQQFQVLNRVLRHNLRNKLNIVRGAIEQTVDGEEVDDALANGGLAAIDGLLELSETARDLANGMQPHGDRDPVAVSDAIDGVVSSLEAKHSTAELSASIRTVRSIPGRVNLEWALAELCENAIEHNDTPNPQVRIVAEPRPENADWIEIRVVDDGPGVPPAQRAVLESGEETKLQHTDGLGLWIVRWIIRGAGGEFVIEDRDERGSVATLRLRGVDTDRETDELRTERTAIDE